MKFLASLNSASGKLGAGAGPGGAFLIQTSIRRADQGGNPGLDDRTGGSGGATGDGKGGASFDKLLQAATRQGSGGSDETRADGHSAAARTANRTHKNSAGDSSHGTPSADDSATHESNSDPAAQQQQAAGGASQDDTDTATHKKGAHANDPADDPQDASNPQAAGIAASAVVASVNQQAADNPQAGGQNSEAGDGSGVGGGDESADAATSGGRKVTLQGVIGKAIALHQRATLPGEAEPDPSLPPEMRSEQLKSEMKQRFEAVAESRPGKGDESAAVQAAAVKVGEPAAQTMGLPTQEPSPAATSAKAAMTRQSQQQNANDTAASAQGSGVAAAVDSAAAGGTTVNATSRLIGAVEKDAAPEKGSAVAGPAGAAFGAAVSVQQHTASHAEVAPAAQESPVMSAQETYDQIVLGLKGQMDPKSGKAQILLDPPNLGAVKVSLSLANGVLTAQFESSTGAVRDLLKSNLDKLKTVLQGQGIAVDKLAVDAPAAGRDSGAAGGQMQQNASGFGNHDGRSAGGFGQESRSGQERWQQAGAGGGFARMFALTQDAPIDLVA